MKTVNSESPAGSKWTKWIVLAKSACNHSLTHTVDRCFVLSTTYSVGNGRAFWPEHLDRVSIIGRCNCIHVSTASIRVQNAAMSVRSCSRPARHLALYCTPSNWMRLMSFEWHTKCQWTERKVKDTKNNIRIEVIKRKHACMDEHTHSRLTVCVSSVGWFCDSQNWFAIIKWIFMKINGECKWTVSVPRSDMYLQKKIKKKKKLINDFAVISRNNMKLLRRFCFFREITNVSQLTFVINVWRLISQKCVRQMFKTVASVERHTFRWNRLRLTTLPRDVIDLLVVFSLWF